MGWKFIRMHVVREYCYVHFSILSIGVIGMDKGYSICMHFAHIIVQSIDIEFRFYNIQSNI